jgi:small subunit ribosomal protein S4
MARYTEAKCRLCRREGVKLYLKGTRCWTVKCTLNKRERPPGATHWRRPRPSDYAVRLREKQKLKRIYGILESQFQRIYSRADRMKGNTGENLLVLLERRLDNMVYRAGFGLSRNHARQLVNHGHVLVNGRRVDVASYLTKVGDVITPREREKTVSLLKENRELGRHIETPSWLEVQLEPTLEARVVELPKREALKELGVEVQEQLVVEFCSR